MTKYTHLNEFIKSLDSLKNKGNKTYMYADGATVGIFWEDRMLTVVFSDKEFAKRITNFVDLALQGKLKRRDTE